MSIKFEVGRRHLLAANFLILRHRPGLWIAWFCVAAILALPGLFNRRGVCGCVTNYMVLFAMLLIALTVVYVALIVLSTLPYRRNDGFLGDHTIELSAEGVIESTNLNRSLHRWASIQDIYVDRGIVLFVLGVRVHVIPRAAFPDARSVDEFVDLARRYAGAVTGPHGVDARLKVRAW